MLIALLFSVLFATAAGSPGSFFLVPDLKKEIKKNVTDSERKAALLALSKDTERSIKAFSKSNKPYLKKIPDLYASREASREELETLLEASFAERKVLQGQLVEASLRFQELCTREEWDEIIDLAFQPSPKQRRKLEKASVKAITADQKPLEKIREVIESEIEDSGRRAKALESFEAFESELLSLQDHIRNMDAKNQETLRTYGVSAEELSAVYAEQNRIRDEVYAAFLDMHDEMIEATTEDEWAAISKKMKKIFK